MDYFPFDHAFIDPHGDLDIHPMGVGNLVIENLETGNRVFKNVIVETVKFVNGFLSFEIDGTDEVKNIASHDLIVFSFEYEV